MLTLSEKFNLDGFPVSFIERYRSADSSALKVGLFLLFGNIADIDGISKELSIPISDVERSLNYWLAAGFLTDASAEKKKPDCSHVKKPVIPQNERRMPTTKIAKYLRNPEIAALLQEAQAYLGRTLSQNESERLLCIYEYDELPVEVILIIVAYSKKRAKRNLIGFIEKIAREWKEDEIDTSIKAEEHLAVLDMRERRYKLISELLDTDVSVFKFRDRLYIDQWFEQLGYDGVLVEEAKLQSGNNSVAYLNKILRSWSEKGYRTVKDTRQEISQSAAPVTSRRKKSGSENLFQRSIRDSGSKNKGN